MFATARRRSVASASTRSSSPARITPTRRPTSRAGTSRRQRYGIAPAARRRDPGAAARRPLRRAGPGRPGAAPTSRPRAPTPTRSQRRCRRGRFEVAERIAGPLGVGLPAGEPGLYLCHTLCELGAEPAAELADRAAAVPSHPDPPLHGRPRHRRRDHRRRLLREHRRCPRRPRTERQKRSESVSPITIARRARKRANRRSAK